MFKVGEKVRLKEFSDLVSRYCIDDDVLRKLCGGFVTIAIVRPENRDGEQWYKIMEADFNWKEDMFIGQPKNETIKYSFRDEKGNLDQVCADSLESGLKSFLIVSKDVAIIGLLPGGKVTINGEGRGSNEITKNLPYNIYEIKHEDVGFWRKKLIQFSADYDAWRTNLDDTIKDRSRVKVNESKYTVMGF